MTRIPLRDRLPGPVAYVLGGGASYGAVQVGMLRALAETDLVPDLVVGTSVGSLNGAIVATDPASAAGELGSLWAGLRRDAVFPTRVRDAYATVRGRPYLVDPAPMAALLRGALSATTFEELAVPFVAIAVDLDVGDVVALDRGNLESALLASSAIPGVYPWVEREGRRLVDGGVLANVPLATALQRGARTLVVLDCGFVARQPRRTDTFLGVLLQTAAVMTAGQAAFGLRLAQEVAATVLYLPGPWPISSPPYAFERAGELAAASYAMSAAYLRNLRLDGPGVYGLPPGASG